MIPPFIQQIIGAIIRALVVWLGGYLYAKAGIQLTEEQTGQIVAYLAPMLGVIVWSLYSKFIGRQKLLTALGATKPMTEQDVEQRVKDPASPTPSVLTPKTEVPQ